MKIIKKLNYLTLIFILILTGCQTTRRRSSVDSNLKNAVQNHESRISELTFQLKAVADSNNQAIRRLNELIKENSTLKNEITELKRNIALLNKALETERNNRQAETKKMLKDIVQQITSAVNSRNQAIQRQNQSSNGPATKGSFYEYTVQPGATLGAIAKAYKVSVSDIKKANKLKSDFIRVGQKLYIPKK